MFGRLLKSPGVLAIELLAAYPGVECQSHHLPHKLDRPSPEPLTKQVGSHFGNACAIKLRQSIPGHESLNVIPGPFPTFVGSGGNNAVVFRLFACELLWVLFGQERFEQFSHGLHTGGP